MPLTAIQTAYRMYGWHTYSWSATSAPATGSSVPTVAASPAKNGASVLVTLPAGSLGARVNVSAGARPGAPNTKSPTASVAGGGNVTLVVPDLKTGTTYYVRAGVVYSDGSQALNTAEQTVVPT